MPPDFYQVLGVSRDCSPLELKRAYRRLARRYHPDVCPEDDAEERFKEISQAYATLSDPERRQQYDLYGDTDARGTPTPPTDLFDLFRQAFGGMSGRGGPFGFQTEARGKDLQYEVTIDLEAVATGLEAEVEVSRQAECETCGGSGAAPGSSPQTCRTCGGRGQVIHRHNTILGVMATSTVCPDCRGRGTVISVPCADCRGRGVVQETQPVLVTIPPGIADGQRIRMPGQGDVPTGGGIPGDLLVLVRVQRHPLFVRHDRDLHMPLDLSFTQAALGDRLIVPTIDGEAEITVPAGAQSGDTISLPGHGLPPLHGGKRGRQIIELRVVTPTDLNDEQRQLLMELALRRGEEVHPPEHEGLLRRIKQVLTGET